MKFVYFVLIIVLGLTAIYFSFPLYKITGSFDWVDKYLGPGGTITFWRLIGVALVILAFVYLIYF